jgi:hypothetical protein
MKSPRVDVMVQGEEAFSVQGARLEVDHRSFKAVREERLGATGEPGSSADGPHGNQAPENG